MNREQKMYFEKKLKKIPRYPRMNPPYRVHWNWDISYRCNYNCSYCQVMKRDEEYVYRYLDPGVWKDIFDRIFDMYWCTHFRFSGGEPTAYPGFLDFLGKLMEKNTADITTNLSFEMEDFLKKVPPGMGLSVSSSFHPEYNEMKSFLEKVKYLHYNGYPSTISYVGYPPHLEKLPEYKKRVEGEGIYFKIIPFSGEYGGKQYPESYTPRERKLLKGEAAGSGDEHLNRMNTRWYEHHVEKKEPEKETKKGIPCQMGQMYAVIHPDMEVTRCCAGYHGTDSGVLGKITDPDFRLLDEPSPCEVGHKCPCFKAMTTGMEEDKWVPLWEALEHPVYKTGHMREYVDFIRGGEDK